MKITPQQAAHILMEDKNANWSYNGAVALCEYLGDMELDVVAIRCDFTEYSTAWDAASDYGFECDREDEEDYQERGEEEALEYLQKNTTVVVFNGGIIVGRF